MPPYRLPFSATVLDYSVIELGINHCGLKLSNERLQRRLGQLEFHVLNLDLVISAD